jgi:hypothetical protein
MTVVTAGAGQIWRDDCYYFDPGNGKCMRKYVLVLAVEAKSGDRVTAVFTSKSHGLTENPACSLGPPRAGFFVGIPGGTLTQPTWVDFSSIITLDSSDLATHARAGRKSLIPLALPDKTFCAVLRCALQCEDITLRETRWIGNTAAVLGCP